MSNLDPGMEPTSMEDIHWIDYGEMIEESDIKRLTDKYTPEELYGAEAMEKWAADNGFIKHEPLPKFVGVIVCYIMPALIIALITYTIINYKQYK